MPRRLVIVSAIACGIHACSSFGTTNGDDAPIDGGSDTGAPAADTGADGGTSLVDANDGSIARECVPWAILCDRFDNGARLPAWVVEGGGPAITFGGDSAQLSLASKGSPTYLRFDDNTAGRTAVSFGATVRVTEYGGTAADYVEVIGIEALGSAHQFLVKIYPGHLDIEETSAIDEQIDTLPLSTARRVDVLVETVPARKLTVRIDGTVKKVFTHQWTTSAADKVRLFAGAYYVDINGSLKYSLDDVFYDAR